ncbi:MAG: bifunctional folylpolyglutamate synthase/dihydrofolate synthase [Cetobacterium sp.]|nr:bifunctional folylpolyglutamate synthase/dihydrofolate synthase [Cetobacterium sp.]
MEMEKLLNELYSHSLTNIKLGLENIKNLCEKLGNPQNDYRIIHVGGTNGKGSTSTTIEKVLLENGYKVGKYTSPHILKFNERIQVSGVEISDEEVAKYYYMVKEIMAKYNIGATFFEITTAMMFKYFSDKKVDFAVIEVGLGGKYDATNVAHGEITIITNVTLDHTEFLGNDIYTIALEKGGIIKDDSYVIVGSSEKEFLRGIETSSKNYINVLEKYKNSKFNLNFENFTTEIEIENEKFISPLFGIHQYNNFLCAYEGLKKLGISNEDIKQGLKKVVWPCRFEIMKKDKNILILDGAHNIDSMSKLKETVLKHYKKDEIVTITSILKDKKIEEMVPILREFSGNIILTSLKENSRGLTGEELKKYFTENLENIVVEEDIKKSYEKAVNLNKKLIIICGSFYLLSKFKEEVK